VAKYLSAEVEKRQALSEQLDALAARGDRPRERVLKLWSQKATLKR
jgi:hypothetical protein